MMSINGYNEANNILKNLRKFSIGDSNNKQRSASIITKNDQDRICSTKIKEIIKIADDHVNLDLHLLQLQQSQLTKSVNLRHCYLIMVSNSTNLLSDLSLFDS